MGRAADEPLGVQPLGVLGLERKTSNGKPWRACCASWFEPPKDARAVASIFDRTSVREAAASTVAFTARLRVDGRRGDRGADRHHDEQRGGASPLHHHARRLDHAGRAGAGLRPERLGRLAGDDRDDARRLRHVDLDAGEQPVHLDRAHDAAEPISRRQRLVTELPAEPSTSDAGTTRRLALSRSTRIRPSRSQRRSVSRLIPSARAASAAPKRCLALPIHITPSSAARAQPLTPHITYAKNEFC